MSRIAIIGGAKSRRYSASSSLITPVMTASRTSGPAPLAVFFDATGTTHSNGSIDTFRQLGYSFNFGDPGQGSWTYSGVDKNVHRGGPLCAHVFETPGTYEVKVKARDSNGYTSQVSQTITVTDPDSVFSGTNTICLSRSGVFTGVPTGASQQTISSWPAFAADRRYLLHRGEDFSSLGALSFFNRSDIQIGAYGSGALPIVSGLNIESGNPGSGTNWGSRIVLSDLYSTGALRADNSPDNMLVLRVQIGTTSTTNIAFSFGTTTEYYYDGLGAGAWSSAIKWPTNIFVVDCVATSGFDEYSSFWAGRNVAFLGNDFENAVYHNLRSYMNQRTFIAHNRLRKCGSVTHQIKLHAKSGDAYGTDYLSSSRTPRSEWGLIANNDIGSTGEINVWAVAVGPQNAENYELMRRFIVENNPFGFDFQQEVALGGEILVSRGNTSVGTLNEMTGAHMGSMPGVGEYYTGGASITTEDPT